jgi:hypothetical protein
MPGIPIDTWPLTGDAEGREGIAMWLIRESRIDGIFEGYGGSRVYWLTEGSRWRQADNTAEYVYRESPKARLLDDGRGHTYLDVEGTSGIVWVERDGSRPVPHTGAF